jgi:hypothetical protein
MRTEVRKIKTYFKNIKGWETYIEEKIGVDYEKLILLYAKSYNTHKDVSFVYFNIAQEIVENYVIMNDIELSDDEYSSLMQGLLANNWLIMTIDAVCTNLKARGKLKIKDPNVWGNYK